MRNLTIPHRLCLFRGRGSVHYYDEIGLLKPCFVDEQNGYRFYGKQKALAEQKRLLTLKKDRLERLIEVLERAEKGEITMSAFDNSEYETARQQYEDEAKLRWGGADACGRANTRGECKTARKRPVYAHRAA